MRRPAADDLNLTRHRAVAVERWRHAVEIRREWLATGLCAEPADRAAAEQCLTRIYARLSRTRPRFLWVESPHRAVPLLAGLPTLDDLRSWVRAKRPPGQPPLASDLAATLSRLRGALDECLTHPDLDPPAPRHKGAGLDKKSWFARPPEDDLAAGVPLREMLRHGVWAALQTSLAAGFAWPVRAALTTAEPLPVCWYGQQDAGWIAYYDVARRLGLARFAAADQQHLDDWAGLARSCGWWWPGEQVCVVVERPAVVPTEPVPGGRHEQVRLRLDGRRRLEYRDGWHPPLPAAHR